MKVEKNRRYAEAEVVSFEVRMGICLPVAYRRHLMDVGAGHDPLSKVNLLDEWAQPEDETGFPRDFLQKPFPHEQAWNDRSLFNPQLGSRSPYYDKTLICGAMRVTNTGCEGYHLLVVSGPEAGNMWHDDRACDGKGIYPLKTLNGNTLTFEEYVGEVRTLPWHGLETCEALADGDNTESWLIRWLRRIRSLM